MRGIIKSGSYECRKVICEFIRGTYVLTFAHLATALPGNNQGIRLLKTMVVLWNIRQLQADNACILKW